MIIFFSVSDEFFLSAGCEKYKLFRNKRLGNVTVIEHHVVTSHGRCAALCHDNKRCYAVNIIETNQMVCELSTGLSSEEEMVDDVTSFLYVLGEFTEILSTGLSNEEEMVDDVTFFLYGLGEFTEILSTDCSSEDEMVDDVTSFLYVLGEFTEILNTGLSREEEMVDDVH